MKHRELERARAVLVMPRLADKTREDWMQVVRFCVVGGSGYVVNLVVFAFLVRGLDVHYTPAAALSFVVAVTNNFLLNKYWTFQRHDERAQTQGLRYLVVSMIALGMNLLILWGLVALHVPDIPAQALAVMAVTPLNFLLNHRWTFVMLDDDRTLVPRGPVTGKGPDGACDRSA